MIIVTLAGAAFGVMEPAAAATLRCGSILIEPGDDAAYVFEKCVESESAETDTRSAWTSGANNRVLYPIGYGQPQRWRIVRAAGQFRAVLVIGADGRVEDIEFDTRRD